MTLFFGDTGTLVKQEQGDDVDVIFPFQSTEIPRGGAFWCIPNFDELPEFPTRHGEYRKTTSARADSSKTLEGSWGKLRVDTSWEEYETGFISEVTLTSLSYETLVRPGFHPYFLSSDSLNLSFQNEKIRREEIPVNEKKILLCNDSLEKISTRLSTGEREVEIVFTAYSSNKEYDLTYGLCLWTDNITEYICVEPSVGTGRRNDGLPDILKLRDGENLTIRVEIKTL